VLRPGGCGLRRVFAISSSTEQRLRTAIKQVLRCPQDDPGRGKFCHLCHHSRLASQTAESRLSHFTVTLPAEDYRRVGFALVDEISGDDVTARIHILERGCD
jgi:hypothetical protein